MDKQNRQTAHRHRQQYGGYQGEEEWRTLKNVKGSNIQDYS